MFEPIRTERLVLRAAEESDAEALWRRRGDPKVAEYQNWEVPYPREDAERLVAEAMAMDGPEDEKWWMATVETAEGEVVGDVVAHLTHRGRTAEIGYTFASHHWGCGYAAEAASALVDYLFESRGVSRVFGMLHPDNPASARVLERVGMRFEGHTRNSFWLADEVSDDWIYGMTRADWEAWRDRPRDRPESVELVEVAAANFTEVYALATHKTQESFVAPVAKSLSQALIAHTFEVPTEPWLRAIYADETAVGFVMVNVADPEPFLWRLLIDRLHQRRGVASMALDLVEDEMRSLGHTAWKTSWVPGRGSPEPFYLGLGFEPTGEVEGDEVVARKRL